MYPRRELKHLARLRMMRIRSIDRRRRETCDIVHRVASPVCLLDWAVSEWHATQFPVSLAMVPMGLLFHRFDHSRLKSVQRTLRSALVVLRIARQLDRKIAVRTTDITPFPVSGAGGIPGG